MSVKYEVPVESDEDDEDYLPEGQSSASEEESEIDEVDDALENNKNFNVNVQKRCKKGKHQVSKRVKNEEIHLSKENLMDTVIQSDNKVKVLDDDEQKKRADSLWADFLKDSDLDLKSKSKNTPIDNNISSGKSTDSCTMKSKIDNDNKTSKVFEFAGEKVEIEKEILSNSAQDKLLISKPENTRNIYNSSVIKKNESKDNGTRKIGVGGGISAILGRLEKKTKINTLEKSKMDWDNFKKQEDIEEEINSHNRGKDGYLEKQDFLQRADFRQFEIEKRLRNSSRRSNR